MNKVPLTVQGAEKLRAELEELKTVVRPRIIASIASAREHGDLKENAEYHAAREQQSFAEGRIEDGEFLVGDQLTVADIAMASALGYMDLRYAHPWRDAHPRLARWFAVFSRRPSFSKTAPP